MSMNDDRGWVRPVTEGGDAGLMDPIEPTGRTLRSSVVSGIILVAVVAVAIAAVVMWRGRNGDPFASARSIPADMDLVVTFDALALSDSEQLQDFVDAFAVPLVDAGVIDDYPDDIVAAIDDELSAETNFTLSGDVFPWIGRSVSIAIGVPEFDPESYLMPDPPVLVSADVRDEAAAAAFVDKIVAEADGVDVAAAEIAGMPGYRLTDEYSDAVFSLVLAGDTLLFGTEEEVVSAFSAREEGLSIAEDAVFKDVMDRIPSDSMMKVFVSSSFGDDFAELNWAMAAPGMEREDSVSFFDALGIGAGLVEEGVRVNYVMVGVEETGAPIPDADVLAALPDDTIGFLSLDSEPEAEQFDEEAFAAAGIPLDDFSYYYGIDLAGFLEALSGDFTLAVTETRDSSIAEATDVPVGIMGAVGLTDATIFEDFLAALEMDAVQAGVLVNTEGGITTFNENGTDLFSYSINDEMLVIGAGEKLVDAVASGVDGGLLESALYTELDSAIIGDGLVVYVDIQRIVDLVPLTSDEAAVFSPLRGAGWGGTASGDVAEIEMLRLVDY